MCSANLDGMSLKAPTFFFVIYYFLKSIKDSSDYMYMFGFAAGVIGSIIPVKVIKYFGPKVGLCLQMSILFAGGAISILQFNHKIPMNLSYPILCFCAFYSNTYTTRELAKCGGHSEGLTKHLAFFCFIAQIIICLSTNCFGYTKVRGDNQVERYFILGVQLLICFYCQFISPKIGKRRIDHAFISYFL